MINLEMLGDIEEGNNIRRVEYRRYWNTDPVDGIGIPVQWSEDPEQIPKDCGEVVCLYRTGGKKQVEDEGESDANDDSSVDSSVANTRATIRLQVAEGLAMEHGVGDHANFAVRAEMFRECFCGTKAVY